MSNRWWVSGLLGLCIAALAGSAAADPMTHDGFYFRGATGLGYLKSSLTLPAGQPAESLSGLDIGFDAWFGGSPIPGLVIGGGITTFDVPSPTIKQGGTSSSFPGHAMLDIVGAFGDYYFNPNQGMHAEALIGYGVLGLALNDGTTSTNDPSGLALGLGFGNDWWVSDEWSIGVLGRFIYAPLSYSAGGLTEKYSTITPAVMATFTYN